MPIKPMEIKWPKVSNTEEQNLRTKRLVHLYSSLWTSHSKSLSRSSWLTQHRRTRVGKKAVWRAPYGLTLPWNSYPLPHHWVGVVYVRGRNVLGENWVTSIPELAWPLPSLSTAECSRWTLLNKSWPLCAKCWCNWGLHWNWIWCARMERTRTGEKRANIGQAILQIRSLVHGLSFILHNTLLRFTWLGLLWKLGNCSRVMKLVIQTQTPKSTS